MPVTSLLLALALLGAQAPPAPAHTATLRDLGFMAGHWVGGEGDQLSEEVWTEPNGDSMLGMWRFVSGGKVRVTELLMLKQDADGVAMRLRHFDPTFVAREEKDKPVVLRLIAHGANDARFEGPSADGTGVVRIAYRRSGDMLEATLERDGKPQRFTFTRKKR